MAQFCKHCGTPLNDDKTCPRCLGVAQTIDTGAAFCKRCGSQLNEDNVCPMCAGAAVVEKPSSIASSGLGPIDSSMFNRAVYERGMLVSPESIEPNEGEVHVRQYNFAVLRTRLKLMRAEGRLQVTNKRLLFRATGRSLWAKTVLQHEFAVEDIAGVEMQKNRKFSPLSSVLGALLTMASASVAATFMEAINEETKSLTTGTTLAVIVGILAMFLLFGWRKGLWLKQVPLGLFVGSSAACLWRIMVIGGGGDWLGNFLYGLTIIAGIVAALYIFYVAHPPNLEFYVKTKTGLSGTGSVIVKRDRSFGWLPFGVEYSGFSEVLPGVDTDRAIRELGSVINDIQKLGDRGVEKWRR